MPENEINIFVMDDDKEITDLIEINLRAEGYNVFKSYGADGVMDAIEKNEISLAILDIMIPGGDGVKICEEIREKHNIPIIMLTAKSGDKDKITGLAAGADDYITKPFSQAELAARVKAQLRRYLNLNSGQKPDAKPIETNGLVISRVERTVMVYGEPVELTPMEFDILYLLASNLNKVFSAEEIFRTVWNEKYFENSNNTVMVHIRHIREKLGDSGKRPRIIKTMWGVGYKIEK